MTIAFAGDPECKAALLDMLARGEPIADSDALAAQSGLPLPIAALLLVLAPRVRLPGGGASFVHQALAGIAPGADLHREPIRVALFLLDAPEIAGGGGLLESIRALHRQQFDGISPDPDMWKQIRRAAMAAPEDAADRIAHARAAMSKVACWPADRGRSTLPAMLSCWIDLAELEADADWTEEDARRSAALLDSLWNAHHAARAAGEPVHYPNLFHAAEPDLARRYEINLTRTNRRVRERYDEFAAVLLRMLAEAPAGSNPVHLP